MRVAREEEGEEEPEEEPVPRTSVGRTSRRSIQSQGDEEETFREALVYSVTNTASAVTHQTRTFEVHHDEFMAAFECQRVSQEDYRRGNALVLSNLRKVITALREVLKVLTQVRDHFQERVYGADTDERVLTKDSEDGSECKPGL
jgi:hypothetical protein